MTLRVFKAQGLTHFNLFIGMLTGSPWTVISSNK